MPPVLKFSQRHWLALAALGALFALGVGGTGALRTSPCQGTAAAATQSCYFDLLRQTATARGEGAALELFAKFYGQDPTFAQNCHGYAHILGELAYQRYTQTSAFPIRAEVTYCGYGFYHGFMSKLLAQPNAPPLARELCSRVARALPPTLTDACYHGIGHGALSVAAGAPADGPQDAIDRALALCAASADTDAHYLRCASGVYMQFAVYATEGEPEFGVDPDDPLAVCRAQAEREKNDCYTQMQVALNWLAGNDLARAARYVEGIREDGYAAEAILTLAGSPAHRPTSAAAEVRICRGLQERLRHPCIQGLALRFLLNGTPGSEHREAARFCQTAELDDPERQACFSLVQKHASAAYPAQILRAACRTIEARYRGDLCRETTP